MATRTASKAGFISDTAVMGTVPVDGDTVDLAGFDVTCDKSFTGSGITLQNTGGTDAHLILASSHINVNIAGTGTLTHKAIVQGSPSRVINNNNTAAGKVATGGV